MKIGGLVGGKKREGQWIRFAFIGDCGGWEVSVILEVKLFVR